MAVASSIESRTLPAAGRVRRFLSRLSSGDSIAYLLTLLAAGTIFLITAIIFYELYAQSAIPRHKFGWHFLITQTWDPVGGQFGALPFSYGTIVTSLLAMLIAVPQGIGSAIFLSELAPPRISDGLTFMIELLAAVPSVLYGLIGFYVL